MWDIAAVKAVDTDEEDMFIGAAVCRDTTKKDRGQSESPVAHVDYMMRCQVTRGRIVPSTTLLYEYFNFLVARLAADPRSSTFVVESTIDHNLVLPIRARHNVSSGPKRCHMPSTFG